MPRELTQNDIDALKIKLGYNTAEVTLSRETVDALIEAWEDNQANETDGGFTKDEVIAALRSQISEAIKASGGDV